MTTAQQDALDKIEIRENVIATFTRWPIVECDNVFVMTDDDSAIIAPDGATQWTSLPSLC